MTAQEVLDKILEAGGQIIPDPERPRLLVPRDLKRLVTQHRETLRALVLRQGAHPLPEAPEAQAARPADLMPRLLQMPLDIFERDGCPIEVRVRWLEVTLWFVPTIADVGALALAGISRGRIWTAAELMDLLAIPRLTPEQVRIIVLAKVEFGGEVREVRPFHNPERSREPR